MAGKLSLPTPDFDVESAIEKALAVIEGSLTPSVDEAVKDVAQARKRKPLADEDKLIRSVTRSHRIKAARAVSYSLPAILPGWGTVISAAAIPVALGAVLKEVVATSIRVGLIYERDLSDAEIARPAVLLVLAKTAVDLDLTKQVRPADIFGEHAPLLTGLQAFDRLLALTKADRKAIASSQQEVLQAWAVTVGVPLVAGLAPFGIGPMAAANYVQYVMRQAIRDSVCVFAPEETAQRDKDMEVPLIQEEELASDALQ